MAGNANSGRRLDRTITDALRRRLLENDAKALTTIVNVWVSKAMAGDMQAVTQVVDRLEGKALQQTENHNINEHSFAVVGPEVTDDKWKSMLEEIRNTDAPVVSGRTKHNGNGAKSGTH